MVDPRTPVIVGVGQFTERVDAPDYRGMSSVELATEAVRAALADTGADVGAVTAAIAALRRHIYLEEEFLFPPMMEELAIPIGVMLREHGELWRTLATLEAQLAEAGDADVAAPICEQLLSQLELHNSKEEPIIYPQADAVLETDANMRLHDFLDEGRMPVGWRCEKAE